MQRRALVDGAEVLAVVEALDDLRALGSVAAAVLGERHRHQVRVALAVARHQEAQLVAGHPREPVDVGQRDGGVVGEGVGERVELVDEEVAVGVGAGDGHHGPVGRRVAGRERGQVHVAVGDLPVVGLDVAPVERARLLRELCVGAVVVQEPAVAAAVVAGGGRRVAGRPAPDCVVAEEEGGLVEVHGGGWWRCRGGLA